MCNRWPYRFVPLTKSRGSCCPAAPVVRGSCFQTPLHCWTTMIHLDELWWPHCDVTGMIVENGNYPQMAPNDHISAILKVSKLLWLWFSQMIPFVAYFWSNHLRPEDNCWFIRSIQFSKQIHHKSNGGWSMSE